MVSGVITLFSNPAAIIKGFMVDPGSNLSVRALFRIASPTLALLSFGSKLG